jgi:hypothetical protein
MNFSDLVGQKILIHTAIGKLEEYIAGGSTAIVEVTGVENGGIWVKHEGLESGLAKLAKMEGTLMRSLPNVQIQLFLPFASIVFCAYRQPVLDEGSLSLAETP